MRKLAYEEIFASRPTLEELEKLNRFPFYCVAENVRSLYNVGSIFRTSDAVRLQKLFLTGYTGFPPRKEIDKTALGAVDSVPWQHIQNSPDVVWQLKKQHIQIIALEHTSNSVPFNEFDYQFPLCLLLGNEVEGLTEELIDLSDAAVEIPMFGLKQSLNVSVAFGVVMFQILCKYLRRK